MILEDSHGTFLKEMEVKGIKANLSFHEVISMECNNMISIFVITLNVDPFSSKKMRQWH